MDEKLKQKSIKELCQYSFYIPAYQRGYRWTSLEVDYLLDDINGFEPRPIQNSEPLENTCYYLQPIVVKNRQGNEYEVIDGQQRLTTIYMILHYLNQNTGESLRDKLFEIDYQTRKNTALFLKNLGTEQEEHEDNIDFHYIRQAYEAIKNWFDKKDYNFDRFNFISKFISDTKIIWYESIEEDTISVFTRLNSGKINLTNSELIKALYLNSSNFIEKEPPLLKQKQREISMEWDNIENTLHNNRFWYFISSDNKKENNRIEFIFDIMSNKPDTADIEKDLSLYVSHTFRYFSEKFADKKKDKDMLKKNWDEVKKYFQRFSEWYNERKLYHKIGYLVCENKDTIRILYADSSEMKKSEFETYLDKLIRKSVTGIKINELEYGDKKIKSVLLLYNILTMLKNNKDDSKFPFDIYKNENWDIEHVTAIKEDKDLPKNNIKQWLLDVLPYIDVNKAGYNSLIESIKGFDENNNNDKFNSLFDEIIIHFDENIGDEEINHISNLALLDSETNRSYKNAVFLVKRKTIIERDKNGTFIPICTKNVFLKYFTDYPPKISFWTKDDREKYQQDLSCVLKDYLEE